MDPRLKDFLLGCILVVACLFPAVLLTSCAEEAPAKEFTPARRLI